MADQKDTQQERIEVHLPDRNPTPAERQAFVALIADIIKRTATDRNQQEERAS